MHSRKELTDSLAAAGLKRDDTVVIHSSASSAGETEGGVDGILKVFTEYFGETGLCVFPAMTYTLLHNWDPGSAWCKSCSVPRKYCFAHGLEKTDIRCFHADMPCCTGALPNRFLKLPGVCRSLSPTSSVAALGRGAESFVAGHELCRSGCAKGSPWEKLLLRGGKILLIGVTVEEMTFLHGVTEWSFPEQCRSPRIPFEIEVYDAEGKRVESRELYRSANISNLTPHAEQALREGGAVTDFRFGDAPAMLIGCRSAFELITELLRNHPDYL